MRHSSARKLRAPRVQASQLNKTQQLTCSRPSALLGVLEVQLDFRDAVLVDLWILIADETLMSASDRRLSRTGDFCTVGLHVRERTMLFISPDCRREVGLARALVIAVEALLHLPVESEVSGALLNAILTIGIHSPDNFLAERGLLVVKDNNDPLAATLGRAMAQAATAFNQRRLESVRNPGALNCANLTPDIILASVCAFTFALAIKAVSCYNSAIDNALTRIGVMVDGGSAHLDQSYLLSRRMMTTLAQLIRGQMTVRWVVVGLSLQVELQHTKPWIKVVKYLSEYVQDTGIAVFVLIRDLLLQKVPELTFYIFNCELTRFKEACVAYVELKEYGPYVRFLERPEAILFQAGRFPNLVQFMRGFASEFNPRAVDLLTGGGVQVPAIYNLGVRAGRRAAANR
ncbi:polycystic kidney disease protein 1-like 2 [Xyrichtys novacula]|uniref:Polycystic kidney disease protein 1-like 2 n=1 Tax=Xyrichtys novacula TaxID=13765 RepID=A0AAV1ET93_XYRNO|nr:polycystic kidney disease protein 1-like 2 [Xyrichtys novacula]